MLIFTCVLHGEIIEIYRCNSTLKPNKKITDDAKPYVECLSLGERIGKLETGDLSLSDIIQVAKEDSWVGEPFYGPVEKYIFKDFNGQHYVAHFEFKKGHELFGKGRRVAINRIAKISGAKEEFSGSPYNGSSVYSEVILKKLRSLVQNDSK